MGSVLELFCWWIDVECEEKRRMNSWENGGVVCFYKEDWSAVENHEFWLMPNNIQVDLLRRRLDKKHKENRTKVIDLGIFSI